MSIYEDESAQSKIMYFKNRYHELKLSHKNYEIKTAITGSRIDILAIPFLNINDSITAHININSINNFEEEIDRLFYTIEDTIALRENPDSELYYYLTEDV